MKKRKTLMGIEPYWKEHWRSMPDFVQDDCKPMDSVKVNFFSPEDRDRFAELVGQLVTRRTKSVHFPAGAGKQKHRDRWWRTDEPVNPRHPVYVISKGRWESRLTSRALEMMKVPYRIVIEPQEYDNYAAVIDPAKILVLPFSDLGQGSIPARNWVWEHSISEGHEMHWILDDNIHQFWRLHDNFRRPVCSGVVFRVVEDFIDRYENVGQAGLNYYMFHPDKWPYPAFYLNTRIYSCILNRNDISHRWRGRYNEDTDLSLRILKDGWCTVLFCAFLADKAATMRMKGGNTESLYLLGKGEGLDVLHKGRSDMTQSLIEQHPDVVRSVVKWGRNHHQVDYSGFRQKLKYKPHVFFTKDPNPYGLYLGPPPDDQLDKLLMIGQAPSEKGDAGDPLVGRIGKRLAKLAGVEFEKYLAGTDRMNLFNEWTGSNGKGDAWDAEAAREKADELKDELKGRRVLFVGRNVAAAFGHKDLPWLSWTKDDAAVKVAVIPHPSGIVTWWNDPENRKAAGAFLSKLFE